MEEVRIGDYGFPIQLNIVDSNGAFDISSSTEVTVRFKKPNGVRVDKTASFLTDGTDGKIYYVVEDGLFDMAGIWKANAIVVAGILGQWSTSSYSFEVKAAL